MLIEDIRELLALPPPAEPRPLLERVDATLTAGYAHALQLEAERSRLERRIGEVASHLGSQDVAGHTDELADLARRVTEANEDIARLRSLLGSLRDRRRDLRDAA